MQCRKVGAESRPIVTNLIEDDEVSGRFELDSVELLVTGFLGQRVRRISPD